MSPTKPMRPVRLTIAPTTHEEAKKIRRSTARTSTPRVPADSSPSERRFRRAASTRSTAQPAAT
ncbi:hypothetical protein BE08_16410 [Sorangium cellulosum]|uniref:Uncharacterized protein n=1 Tax=Sorangium cellulosum TaxID=56 RepID=A0A150P6I3_SORCE|nr:hypothetical protein BE08_16410 [Sorangium cellulosum]